MAHVSDLGFSMEDLNDAISRGEVRVQSHPDRNLCIYNYTENTQFTKHWNKITLACRGLVLEPTSGTIVARPWEKFFNFGERNLQIAWDAPVEVTDKMDGSLGILYFDGINWAIATRGSFQSDQAWHASNLLRDRYDRIFERQTLTTIEWMAPGITTFLFEIIYPENRIVVNYGMMDDLVLLGAVNNKHGYYHGPVEAASMLGWPGPVTETFHYNTFGDAVSAKDREGKEGIVIRSGNKMLKLKQADYVELHRLVTNLSPKTIWEMLGDGKTIVDICSDIPDEFHEYVEKHGYALLSDAGSTAALATAAYHDIVSALGGDPDLIPRKKFAELAGKSEHRNLLFLLLDGKDIRPVIWKSLKPRADKLISSD